jgi:hypothetical protein
MAFNINDFSSHVIKYGEFAKTDKFDVLVGVPAQLQKLNLGFGDKELIMQCDTAELPGVAINMAEFRHYGFIKRIPHHLSYPEITLGFYCNGRMLEKNFFDKWVQAMIPSTPDGIDNGLVNYFNVNDYISKLTIRQYSHIADGTKALNGVTVNSGPQTFLERVEGAVKSAAINSVMGKAEQLIAPVGALLSQTKMKDNTRQDSDQFNPDIIYECVIEDAIPVSIGSLPLNWSDDSIHRLMVTFAYKKWYSTTTHATDNFPDAVSNIPGVPLQKDLRNDLKNRLYNNVSNKAGSVVSGTLNKLF